MSSKPRPSSASPSKSARRGWRELSSPTSTRTRSLRTAMVSRASLRPCTKAFVTTSLVSRTTMSSTALPSLASAQMSRTKARATRTADRVGASASGITSDPAFSEARGTSLLTAGSYPTRHPQRHHRVETQRLCPARLWPDDDRRLLPRGPCSHPPDRPRPQGGPVHRPGGPRHRQLDGGQPGAARRVAQPGHRLHHPGLEQRARGPTTPAGRQPKRVTLNPGPQHRRGQPADPAARRPDRAAQPQPLG